MKGILNIMYLYPMWSGLLLTDSLTRDTNSQAELWMRILKKRYSEKQTDIQSY